MMTQPKAVCEISMSTKEFLKVVVTFIKKKLHDFMRYQILKLILNFFLLNLSTLVKSRH